MYREVVDLTVESEPVRDLAAVRYDIAKVLPQISHAEASIRSVRAEIDSGMTGLESELNCLQRLRDRLVERLNDLQREEDFLELPDQPYFYPEDDPEDIDVDEVMAVVLDAMSQSDFFARYV